MTKKISTNHAFWKVFILIYLITNVLIKYVSLINFPARNKTDCGKQKNRHINAAKKQFDKKIHLNGKKDTPRYAFFCVTLHPKY